jgi:probable HAF family extracellular repeat protein
MLKAAAVQGELAEFLGRVPQPVVAARLGQNRGSSSYKALLLFAAVFALPSDPSHAACKDSVCATSPMDLGTLGTNPNQETIQAFAVSDKGTVVVGSAEFPLPSGSTQHAFLWQNGVMVDLGTLGGIGAQGASYALDVNGAGNVVVGAATITTGETHAFRWTKSTGMVDIGTLAGFGATAWAVNSNGSVIVGQSDTLSHATHAFRWTSSGGMSDLGTLGGDYAVA